MCLQRKPHGLLTFDHYIVSLRRNLGRRIQLNGAILPGEEIVQALGYRRRRLHRKPGAERLLQAGHAVTVLDNLSKGSEQPSPARPG